MKTVKYTSETLTAAAAVRFQSSDLGREVSVLEWLKELLVTLLVEEEGFSGKRPFGNSGWQQDAEVALIKVGILKGSLDEDGYVVEIEGWYGAGTSPSTALFIEIVTNLE